MLPNPLPRRARQEVWGGVDNNYAYTSGLQTGGSYGSQFILNPLRPYDNRSVSDFDTKHVVNANFLFNLPIGRGRAWFSDMNKFADAVVGGWQLAGVYRWNSGQPLSSPFDQAQWATNWNVQSNGVRLSNVDFGVDRDTRNVFGSPQAAFNSFRNARPGETGDRNVFRLPGYQTLDLGLTKNFTMPWNENHKFQFRWEVFNVLNHENYGSYTTSESNSSYGNPSFNSNVAFQPRMLQLGFRFAF